MYLATDGVPSWGAGPQVPSNLRGVGLDIGSNLEQMTQPYVDKAVQGVIDRNWPIFEEKLETSLRPVKAMLGVAAIAAGAAAIFGYLSYQKSR
jgi:hypothetical protein